MHGVFYVDRSVMKIKENATVVIKIHYASQKKVR